MSGAILFDLDGTLTDSAQGITEALRYAADRHDLTWPDDETVRTFLGPPLMDTFTGHFGMSRIEAEAAIETYREHYHEIGLFQNRVYPGIPDLLAALADEGRRMAVATSKPTYSATRILEHFDLAKYFEFIAGATLDGSRQNKDQVVAHALESLGGPTGTLTMVGDREHDVRGAARFEIQTVGVLWGYGSAEELLGAGAISIVASPADLLALLRARH